MKAKILITTGDLDGIGAEVTFKALQKIGPLPKVQFIVFKAAKNQSRLVTKCLNSAKWKSAKTYVCDRVEDIISDHDSSLVILELNSNPVEWVELAARYCLNKSAAAMVTAPLSKTLIKSAGRKDVGHTQILKRICKIKKDVYMAFLGPKMNVALLTGHIPIRSVQDHVSKSSLKRLFSLLLVLRQNLGVNKRNKPVAVLGLNPHAGDSGIIDDFESKNLNPWIRGLGPHCRGPLIPDASFNSEAIAKYSFFIALYHDQGLIPFKSLHGFDDGVHMTLGLPIIRTSVDHGTAKDIFNKNKAKSGSMKAAIEWAVKLAKD